VHPARVPVTTPEELDAARIGGAVVLDVREPEEWDAGHLQGSVHVPMHAVPAWLDARSAQSDRARAGDRSSAGGAGGSNDGGSDRRVVVVCRSGHRSAHVTAWLCEQGVDASNLDGGLLAWAVGRGTLVTDTGAEPFVA
jgi:rhodanese-related sulfurtransferase